MPIEFARIGRRYNAERYNQRFPGDTVELNLIERFQAAVKFCPASLAMFLLPSTCGTSGPCGPATLAPSAHCRQHQGRSQL